MALKNLLKENLHYIHVPGETSVTELTEYKKPAKRPRKLNYKALIPKEDQERELHDVKVIDWKNNWEKKSED